MKQPFCRKMGRPKVWGFLAGMLVVCGQVLGQESQYPTWQERITQDSILFQSFYKNYPVIHLPITFDEKYLKDFGKDTLIEIRETQFLYGWQFPNILASRTGIYYQVGKWLQDSQANYSSFIYMQNEFGIIQKRGIQYPHELYLITHQTNSQIIDVHTIAGCTFIRHYSKINHPKKIHKLLYLTRRRIWKTPQIRTTVCRTATIDTNKVIHIQKYTKAFLHTKKQSYTLQIDSTGKFIR